MEQVKIPSHQVTVRILHGALVAGLLLLGATFFFVLSRQGTLIPGPSNVGLVLAGVAVLLLGAAATILRGRIPDRGLGQSASAYWASTESRAAAILLWMVVDGAGVLGWVGYVLTGSAPPAAAAVLCILALIVFRPARLEGDGAA